MRLTENQRLVTNQSGVARVLNVNRITISGRLSIATGQRVRALRHIGLSVCHILVNGFTLQRKRPDIENNRISKNTVLRRLR